MKIAYLKMTNFMLYKKFKKNFGDKDVVGIICEYKTNKNKSNRGGKTTIMEAIKYALHGNTRAKQEVKLIHKGEQFMEVEVGLIDDDGKTYKIRRGRDHKNKGLLECDWVDKKAEAQKAIDELIGCNGKEFELINYFKQSDINKFMLLPANEKKDHLMKWLDNTHWNKLHKAVDIDLKEKVKELAKKKTKKETIEEGLENQDELEKKIRKTKKKIKKEQEALEPLKKKKARLEKKNKSEDEIDDMESRREELQEQMDELEDKIEETKKGKGIFKALKKTIKDGKKELKKSPYSKEEFRQTMTASGEASHERDELKKKIKMVQKEFCGVCPVLNEGCDRIEAKPGDIKKWKRKVKELDKVCQASDDRLEELEDSRQLEDAVKQAQNEAKLLEKTLDACVGDPKKLEGLQAEYGSLKASLKEAKSASLSSKIDKVNQAIKKVESGLDGLNQKLGQYKSRIRQIGKSEGRISKINKSIKRLEREIEDLKYLALMFGKNGIPSQEIENAFDEIESDINFILGKMGTTFEVSFNADKETTSWESECVSCGWSYPKSTRKKECAECGEPRRKKRKDELHLTVLEHGFESDFEMDSGGGHTFISLAVRIALTLLKKRQTGSQLDVLFFDEIDSALDDDARENIMKLVTWILVKMLGFKQIFWVSHNKTIKESVPHTLKVNRYEKEAKAKWI